MDSALLATHDNYCNRRQPDSSALPGLWSAPQIPSLEYDTICLLPAITNLTRWLPHILLTNLI